MEIGAAAQPEGDHAGADGVVGETVDDDERTGPPVSLIGIERDRDAGRQIAKADVVEGERVGGEVLAGIGVDPVFERRNRNRHGLGADAREIGTPRHQRLLAHPDDIGGELIRDFGRRGRSDEHVAARRRRSRC